MFENLIKQVQAVTTITGHMGTHVSNLHQQLMIGSMTSPILGAQILLGDVSRMLDALQYLPEIDQFDFGIRVGREFDHVARNRNFLLNIAAQTREEVDWIEGVVSELDDAIALVNYELAQISYIVGQLHNLAAGQKESEGIERAAEVMTTAIVPELTRLEQQMQRILEIYKAELQKRKDYIWFLEITYTWVLRFRRDIRAKLLAKARKAEEEEKEQEDKDDTEKDEEEETKKKKKKKDID